MPNLHRVFCLSLLLAAVVVFPTGHADPLPADLPLEGLAARALGPAAVGGRISAIDAVADDPRRIVIGVATGGVWRSDNGGLTWEAIFDDEAVASIGSVAIVQATPEVIWVGTGEGNVRNSTSIGGGIYKSVDGGQSWQLMGLERTERINWIAIHPDDPDTVFAAALGHLWGENPERGIYRTRDGGETWEKVLYVDERTGGTDVKIDPHNPNRIYAALWQHRRWPYYFKSGGPGSGLYVSMDGGDSWTRRTEEDGLPKGELGRMIVAPSPAQPGLAYVLVEAEDSALVRTADGGKTFQIVNSEHDIASRPFYYTELLADPENPDRVYNFAQRVHVSIDGGKTFQAIEGIDCCAPSNTIHIDNHALWINPADPQHLIVGNDGGIAISRDRGETWRFVRNLPLAQFYHVAVDDADPYHVYGGLQDNGSWRGPAEIRQVGGIRNMHWQEVGFGDGFDVIPDPEIPDAGYSMSQGGFLYRWNLATGEVRTIRPDPPSPDTDLRFNWDAAFAQDPFHSGTIYYGSQFVHRSRDRGKTWEVISPDLTTNNPEFQTFRESGGLTPDVTAAENYTTIVTIAPSPIEAGTIWVGSDDGRIHVTRDGGQSWNRVDDRVRGAPARAWVPMIDPSPHAADVAFVVFDDHRRDDMETYVYRASDYGRRWSDLGSDALSGYALSIRQDPVDPELLFLGTEFGLFASTTGGEDWVRFSAGLPTVSVMDLAIQERESDLVLGTHGRGIYVIDDYSALRNFPADEASAGFSILTTTAGRQYDVKPTGSTRFTGNGEFRADNEPYGVMITFAAAGEALPHPDPETERSRRIAQRTAGTLAVQGSDEEAGEAEEEEQPKVLMTVRDTSGETLRRYRYPVHQGINRIVWDLRADGAPPMPGPEERGDEDGLPGGPEVPPGEYEITLSYDEQTASRSALVVGDPQSPYAPEDRAANFEARLKILAMERAAVSAVERIVETRADIETALALMQRQDEGKAHESLMAQAREVKNGLDELEKRFRVPPKTKGVVYDDDKVINRIGLAETMVGSTFDAPSATARTYMALASGALDAALSELNAFLESDVAALRAALSEAGIGLLSAAPVKRDAAEPEAWSGPTPKEPMD
ncbi:MAG: hypothetical protein R3200_15080 [Xanthomonadales bacterium]|nr:hypothetical protein [Xanthomonadales bacterium]